MLKKYIIGNILLNDTHNSVMEIINLINNDEYSLFCDIVKKNKFCTISFLNIIIVSYQKFNFKYPLYIINNYRLNHYVIFDLIIGIYKGYHRETKWFWENILDDQKVENIVPLVESAKEALLTRSRGLPIIKRILKGNFITCDDIVKYGLYLEEYLSRRLNYMIKYSTKKARKYIIKKYIESGKHKLVDQLYLKYGSEL